MEIFSGHLKPMKLLPADLKRMENFQSELLKGKEL